MQFGDNSENIHNIPVLFYFSMIEVGYTTCTVEKKAYRMEQILTLVFGEPKSQNYYLKTSIDEYNEERQNCGQNALPYPKYPTEQDQPEAITAVAIYNLNNSSSTIILRNAGVRTRQGGIALAQEGLQRRIKAVWENKGKIEWFEPTPTGINRREWYLPKIT